MSAGLPRTGWEQNGRKERMGVTVLSISTQWLRNGREKGNAARGTTEERTIGDGFGNTEVKRLSRGSGGTRTASSAPSLSLEGSEVVLFGDEPHETRKQSVPRSDTDDHQSKLTFTRHNA